jgi:hypothetical protein
VKRTDSSHSVLNLHTQAAENLLLDEVKQPEGDILMYRLFIIAALALGAWQKLRSRYQKTALLFTVLIVIVGVASTAEAIWTPFGESLWVIPFSLGIGLVIFLYPIGFSWITRKGPLW